MRRATTLVLTGPMGAGKTTLGRRVAARLGLSFVDLDEAIEREVGLPVTAIFARDGEAAFRAREKETFRALLAKGGVIATGGGTLVNRELRREAIDRAIVISLSAPLDVLLGRMTGEQLEKRPLLAGDAHGKLSSLLETRAEAYAEAHARVSTEGREPEAIAQEIEAIVRRAPVCVPLSSRTYRVEVGAGVRMLLPDAIALLGGGDPILVTDDVVWPAVRDRMPPIRYRAEVILPSGEAHKTIASVERIWDTALSIGIDRRATVLAVGGGVIGDLTGFAAATLLRGIRFVQVPTTLLAMVDASVGGKTAVDRPQGKNLVGAFHQPSLVVADTELLETLPERELRGGMAEVVKTALIGDPALFELLENTSLDHVDRAEMVRACIALKSRVVASDERDETGARAALNFGHTVGHALEAHGGYSRLTHGEAVSLGMIAALRIGVVRGVTEPSLVGRARSLLTRLGLPVDLDREPLKEALPGILSDKKREGSKVAFVLLEGLGRTRNVPLAFDEVVAALGV
ncbi:MAG: 3-dehydroquinate synthase [Polyangiales bacterium]